MYFIRGTIPGNEEPTTISLERLGQDDESESAQGRTSVHELSDDSYVARGLGRGPVNINYSGMFDGSVDALVVELDNLKKMRGTRVELFKDTNRVGYGVLQSVNPSKQTRMRDYYLMVSWRVDLLMEDELA